MKTAFYVVATVVIALGVISFLSGIELIATGSGTVAVPVMAMSALFLLLGTAVFKKARGMGTG